MWRRFIQGFAIILLAGFSVYSSTLHWITLRQAWNPDLILNDPVSTWEQRVSRVKLPSDAGNEIGYIADWDIDPTYAPIDQDEEYVLTQYTFAPLIVKKGDGYEWIIGNFTLPGAGDWLSQKFRDAKIHYYGWGIYLIQRSEP